MKKLTGWFIRNPVAANLAMVLILVLGALSLQSMRIEGLPKIPPRVIGIQTTFPGAHTAQVDAQITRKIERAPEGLDGVKTVQAYSMAGFSSVRVEKVAGYDIQKLLGNLRTRIDGLEDMPQQARAPVITLDEFSMPALYIQVFGDTDVSTLQRVAQKFQQELLALPEVSTINAWGQRDPEILIEVPPAALQRYDLTIADIAARIEDHSVRSPGGDLKTAGGIVQLTSDSLARFSPDYGTVPLIANGGDRPLFLSDIAAIGDGFTDNGLIVRFNGTPAIGFEVLIAQRENLLVISEAVHSLLDRFEAQLPQGLQVAVWGDSSTHISERLSLLRTNALQGLLLVLLILSLFLNVRLAFWVAMGIPISIAGAFFVAGTKWIDYSINDVTTFGLIVALGILVDDAIVVGESIFEERAREPDPIRGTENGVNKVAVATVFGVLTTIAAFFPMLLINSDLGRVLASFSGIVILALLFSLFESKCILPAHLAHIRLDQTPGTRIGRSWGAVQRVARRGLMWTRDRLYAPVLGHALHHRYAVVLGFLAMSVLGIGAITSGQIRVVFFPEIPGQIVTATIEMDPRAPQRLTQNNILEIEAAGQRINASLQVAHNLESPPVKHFLVVMTGDNEAELYAELTAPPERPSLDVVDILTAWRAELPPIEGISNMNLSADEELAGGFKVDLFSRDADSLQAASAEVRGFLQGLAGTSNIRDGLKNGTPELQFELLEEARAYGFTARTLASQIGNLFGGVEVQRLQRDTREVRVVVKSDAKARDTLADIYDVQLRSDTGIWMPLTSVARLTSGYAATHIARKDGKRASTVSATIDSTIAEPDEIWESLQAKLLPDLRQRYPSLDIRAGGALQEEEATKGGLMRAVITLCLSIYILMAIPLKSYIQPLLILAIIPIGFIGAAMGHLIADIPLSLLSFFGMLALAGVVVNDALVLVTRFNQNRDMGMTAQEAALDCGVGRFQAIFLTTVTTVTGLMPLLSETSEQAQYLIPAAVSLAYGEIFATAITLILIPALLVITADVTELIRTRSRSGLREAPMHLRRALRRLLKLAQKRCNFNCRL